MRPIGYMYKRVAAAPDWLKAPQVKDIYALSGCVSADFADYISSGGTTGSGCLTRPASCKRWRMSTRSRSKVCSCFTTRRTIFSSTSPSANGSLLRLSRPSRRR